MLGLALLTILLLVWNAWWVHKRASSDVKRARRRGRCTRSCLAWAGGALVL